VNEQRNANEEESMEETEVTPPLFDVDGSSVMTRITKEDVGRYVILSVHDPLGYEDDVAAVIAGYMEDSYLVADTHMFVTYTGYYKGTKVTVCSTGSGAPETEIALVDFFRFSDADTFIRAGTSGTYLENVAVGDLVIAAGAVRDEGTSAAYITPTYPAFANYEVMLAMLQAADDMGIQHHLGVTRSTDSCQAGQGRPVLGYHQQDSKAQPEYWKQAGILNFERETSIIYTMSSLFGFRACAVNAVVNSTPRKSLEVGAGSDEVFRTVLEGIHLLAKWDEAKEQSGKRYLLPSMMSEVDGRA
jgi:uridine phosphorylase